MKIESQVTSLETSKKSKVLPITKCCKRGEKSRLKARAKYGVSRCDACGLYGYLGQVLSNSLFQYVKDGKERIVREDWDLIEKHAQAIRDFGLADNWDSISSDEKVKLAFGKKEKAFKEAMKWVTDEFQTLWW